MARTFIAFDPRSGKREVIIEVRTDIARASEQDVERFERRLYDRRVHIGLLVTPEEALFVRDTLASLEFSVDSYQLQKLPTPTLFKSLNLDQVASGERFYEQVRRWIDAVAGSWSTFVPDEALPMMLPDMIGGLAQAGVEEWDDVLDAELEL